MKASPRTARGKFRAAPALLFSVLLAACSAAGSPELELASPAFEASAQGDAAQAADGETTAEAFAGGDPALPAKVASLPMLKPEEDGAAAAVAPEAAAAGQDVAAAGTAAPPPADDRQAPSVGPAAPEGPVLEHGGAVLTAGVMPEPPAAAPKKRGFLAAFFGTPRAAAAPGPVTEKPKVEQELAAPAPEEEPAPSAAPKPEAESVRLASLGDERSGEFVLPGVRQTALFEIKRKSGLDDDSDVDLHEDAAPPVELAFAPGLARMAPNGLLKQRESVDVGCLKPDLVRLLKAVERHYGKKMVVTSGYRSPSHNRKVNGAKRSMHMYCAAADVQVPGVSKWELAKLLRSMPGRGGVGTYCHTNSVHIDVGPEREWNWRCRRRKA